MTTFKVGDRVYCPAMQCGAVFTVEKTGKLASYPLKVEKPVNQIQSFYKNGTGGNKSAVVFHATPENRDALQVLFPDIEFEAPPKPMRKIGEWEYPKPERDAPPEGTWVYIPDLQYFPENEGVEWYSTDYLIRCLNAGLVHLTPEAAQAHAEAIILAGGGTVDE